MMTGLSALCKGVCAFEPLERFTGDTLKCHLISYWSADPVPQCVQHVKAHLVCIQIL